MSEPFEASRSLDGEPTTISAFAPILILALVMLAWFGFQATLLRAERDALRDLVTNQAQVKRADDAKKLLDSLDSIARGTQQLADGGNANARLIVEELKKRGITISPNVPTSTTAAPDK
jgi:hypothetical protein